MFPETIMGTESTFTEFILEGNKLDLPEIKNPLYTNFSVHRNRQSEDTDFSVNPDPAPYHTSTFMSSTVAKKVPVTRRHQELFSQSPGHSGDINWNPKRGIILHTDRYSWESSRSLEGMSQKQRIESELDYLERSRSLQRRRECGHGSLELILGGKRISMEERFDINREIQKLKSLVLPQHARDLYHGKGFKLPPNHASIKPHKMRAHLDSEPETSRYRDLLDLDSDFKQRFKNHGNTHPFETSRKKNKMLPRIKKDGYLIGTSPVLLSKERQTTRKLKCRIQMEPTKFPCIPFGRASLIAVT